VVVLVVSDDLELARRVRALAVFVDAVRVVDARSVAVAVEVVQVLYESPSGCPDLVLLDRGSAGAPAGRQLLAGACPGVRVVEFESTSSSREIEATIRRGVRDVLVATR
jgi:hypothetical protein